MTYPSQIIITTYSYHYSFRSIPSCSRFQCQLRSFT